MTKTERERELEAKLAEQAARLAKLEAKVSPLKLVAEPGPRFDPTAAASMPPSAMAEMVAEGNRILPDIAADARKPPPSESLAGQRSSTSAQRAVGSNGWVTAAPMVAEPGLWKRGA